MEYLINHKCRSNHETHLGANAITPELCNGKANEARSVHALNVAPEFLLHSVSLSI